MAKTGANIVKTENRRENIDRLAASNQAYVYGKRLFLIQSLLAFGGTFLLALIALVALNYDLNLDWLRAMYAIVVTILDLAVINRCIERFREKGASIKESFDCSVLSIPWNKILVGEQPMEEEIGRYSKSYVARTGSVDRLVNWYHPDIKNIDGIAAPVICQRSNICYDLSLRRSFLFTVIVISSLIVVVLTTISLLIDLSFRSVVVNVLVPVLPIGVILLRLINEHIKSTETLKSLRTSVEALWADSLEGNFSDSANKIRQVQDKLFINRKSSPLIPEWYYNRKRDNFEDDMAYGVSSMVRIYLSK